MNIIDGYFVDVLIASAIFIGNHWSRRATRARLIHSFAARALIMSYVASAGIQLIVIRSF